MKTKIFSTTTLMVILVACGSGGGGSDVATSTQKAGYSISLQQLSDLPTCTAEMSGSLAYIKADKSFWVCSELAWTQAEVGQNATKMVAVADETAGSNCTNGGKSIETGFDENKDSKLDTAEIETTDYVCNGDKGDTGTKGDKGETGEDGLKISEIWIFHTDTFGGQPDVAEESQSSVRIGTIQLVKFSDGSGFLSVNGNTIDWDTGSNLQDFDFTVSALFKGSSVEQTYIVKVRSFATMRLRLKVNLSSPSIVKAVVDNDGNFSDNTDTTFTLTKQN